MTTKLTIGPMWMTACAVMGGVLCSAAVAQSPIAINGFNSSEEGAYFTPADLGGQGEAASGWAGPWVTSSTSGLNTAGRYVVVAGGSPAGACPSDSPGDPDQHLQMWGATSSSYKAERPMTAWSGDFIFQYDIKLTLDGGLQGGGQIQLEDTSDSSTGKRPLNLKLQLGGFYLNDTFMLPYTGNETFQSMVGNWVTVRIVCDWESQTFDLYWTSKADGCLAYVGRKVGWKDSTFTSGIVQKLRIDAPKVLSTFPNDGMEMDRIRFVTAPPPGPCDTVVLLNSGAETVSVVAGTNPDFIVYALHNGGAVVHSYQVDEMLPTAHGIAGLFSTGLDAAGTPLGGQLPDPHYVLATNPDSADTQTYTSKDDGFPIPPWIASNATSRWITARPNDDDSQAMPGQYVYRTTFTPPGVDTLVYGLLAADDSLTDILINGVSTGVKSTGNFQAWTPFRLNIGALDDTLDFAVSNGGTAENATGVRLEFFDLLATNHAWLSVDPPSPITVDSQTSRAVTAAINTAGLPVGVYSAYLRFKNLDDCDPPNGIHEDPLIRRIELTVTNWEVTPAGVVRDLPLNTTCPGREEQVAQFTVTNLGSAGDLSYTVEKVDECGWLTLDKQGPVSVGPGLSDTVSGTIDPTGLGSGTYTCSLMFTNVGTGLPKQVRTVTLHVVGTVWEYNGDVGPEEPNSAGPGLTFIIHNETPMPVSQGQVEEDVLATDGKVWRLTDSATAKTKFRSQPNTWVSGQLGATIVARVRVHSYPAGSTQGLALAIWDDVTGDSAELFYSGDDGTGHATISELNRRQSATVLGDDQFHVLRMTVKGTETLNRTIQLYFDEEPTPVVSILSASSSGAGIDGFAFGAGSTGGEIDMSFDWLTATDAGAFAPGEEYACLGRSLVVDACPMPFADADGDGDVDATDFAAFQRCYTGSAPTVAYGEGCSCYDRNHDDAVSEFDFLQFAQCATGPQVLWTQELTPACRP